MPLKVTGDVHAHESGHAEPFNLAKAKTSETWGMSTYATDGDLVLAAS